MNRIVCLLLIVLTVSTAQGATYRLVQLFAAPVTAGSDRSTSVPHTVGFRNRSISIRLFSAFAKRLLPDRTPRNYRASRKELSILAFICGIAGLCIPVLGVLLSVAAIVLGIISVSKQAEYQGLAIAGLILGVLGLLVLGIILWGALGFK